MIVRFVNRSGKNDSSNFGFIDCSLPLVPRLGEIVVPGDASSFRYQVVEVLWNLSDMTKDYPHIGVFVFLELELSASDE